MENTGLFENEVAEEQEIVEKEENMNMKEQVPSLPQLFNSFEDNENISENEVHGKEVPEKAENNESQESALGLFDAETHEDENDLTEEEQKQVREIQSTMSERYLELEGEGDRKSLVKASNRRKRKLYGTEHIHAINEELQVQTDGQFNRDAYLELLNSFRYKKPITGRVVMIEESNFMGDEKMVLAKVMVGPYAVTIPAPWFLNISPQRMEELKRESKDRQESFVRLLMNQRIGREIDFVVQHMDEQNSVFIGNRRRAMQIIRDAKFFSKHDGEYDIQEGDLVEARICYTTATKVLVEVFGIEKLLKQEDISYTRISDVSKYLTHQDEYGNRVPDEYVKVRLEKVTREFKTVEKDGKMVKMRSIDIKPSIKLGNADQRDVYLKTLSVGANVMGTVTQVDENGVFCKILNMKLDVKCSNPIEMRNPGIGQTCLIRISRIDMETRFVNGVILSVIA